MQPPLEEFSKLSENNRPFVFRSKAQACLLGFKHPEFF
ncbi:hypothetical protein THIAE_00545 [Thiomicrospira aerophila AL3]|uniref:Uncharacterized protein n=1 Tax=Thiomicrospira aerophila AL3 TaxID=717772 RepID=W0DYY4_9GAMM|nr:hypothetical protein THIAE_00545 [Thiomicrospira aerophila AL3]